MLQDLDAVASGKDDVVLLKEAITNGDIETVEQLLDKGINSLHFVCDVILCSSVKHIPFCGEDSVFW